MSRAIRVAKLTDKDTGKSHKVKLINSGRDGAFKYEWTDSEGNSIELSACTVNEACDDLHNTRSSIFDVTFGR